MLHRKAFFLTRIRSSPTGPSAMNSIPSFPQHQQWPCPTFGRQTAGPEIHHGKAAQAADPSRYRGLATHPARACGRADPRTRIPCNLSAKQKQGNPSLQPHKCTGLAELPRRVPAGVKIEMPRRRANGGNRACIEHACTNEIANDLVNAIDSDCVEPVVANLSIPSHEPVISHSLPPISFHRQLDAGGGFQGSDHACGGPRSYRRAIHGGWCPSRNDGIGLGGATPYGLKSQAY